MKVKQIYIVQDGTDKALLIETETGEFFCSFVKLNPTMSRVAVDLIKAAAPPKIFCRKGNRISRTGITVLSTHDINSKDTTFTAAVLSRTTKTYPQYSVGDIVTLNVSDFFNDYGDSVEEKDDEAFTL